MISSTEFAGLHIPTVTPFTAANTVDLASLDRLSRFQASFDGIAGLVSCARIGEGPVLSRSEKLSVFEVMGKAAHDKKSYISPLSDRNRLRKQSR